MFAEVVVLRNAQAIDRPFTYKVPEHLQSRIKVGDRVLAPFGTSGYLEGIVIGVTFDNPLDEAIKVKDLQYLFDDGIYLSKNELISAATIREETLCSHAEAIALFLPSSTTVTQIKTYRLRTVPETPLKKNERSILSALAMGDLTHEALCPELSDQAKSTAINRLLALGAIDLTYHYEQQVKNRTVDWIVVTGDLVGALESTPARQSARKKLLAYLIEHPTVKRSDVQNALKIQKSVIDRLGGEGLIKIDALDETRSPEFMKSFEDKSQISLNAAQNDVYETIIRQFSNKESNNFLIHGVTGSGKTEVYAQVIEWVIKSGKKAILVVPEISLTPQIVARFASRFGESRIALLHSKITPGERYDQWKGIRRGDYDIVIGARSAVFAPLDDIGAIIIDECHETSYRSEKRPKYDTYDVAHHRISLSGGLLISGSATPSIQDYYESLRGNRTLLKLTSRHNQLELPEIKIIDMREELLSGNRSILSRELKSAIEDRLSAAEQVIILLNRKGHSTFVSCRACGFTLSCPNCDVTLTYFKGERAVRCNYCHYETYIPKKCPKCESTYFKYFGVGTEKVEEQLTEMFPKARIARMDRTTTSRKGSVEQIISDVEAEQTDILIGTQMVAKGLDFKKVTLIGILSADLQLNLPQYHASERAYQLFTQVAGRAGRGDRKGEVILQTYSPDHYALNQPDYEHFYEAEIKYRKALNYPPFSNLVSLVITSGKSEEAENYAMRSERFIKAKLLKKGLQNAVEIYPANPALLKKIDNQYRWQIIIKANPSDMADVREIIKALELHFQEVKGCKIQVDLNATNIL